MLKFILDSLKIFNEKDQTKIKDFKGTTLRLFKNFVDLFEIWKFWQGLII